MNAWLYLAYWMLLAVAGVVVAYRREQSRRQSRRRDRLADLQQVWLADPRPAWETVAAFERDVEKVLRGDVTADYVERMPLSRARPEGLPPVRRVVPDLDTLQGAMVAAHRDPPHRFGPRIPR